MGTKSFVQIEINAVFTTTSGKMQFRSGVFDHFNTITNSQSLTIDERSSKKFEKWDTQWLHVSVYITCS
jgi:hypothetical protein